MATTDLIGGFKEIGNAFINEPSTWWIIAPIFLVWFITSIYLGRHKEEKGYGWHAALGTGLSLFWITVSSLKDLFAPQTGTFNLGKLIFISVIGLYAIFIIYIAFTRKIRGSIFFWIAAKSIGYYLSIVCLLWIHDLIKMSAWIVVDFVIVYFIIVTFGFFMKKLIPAKESHEIEEEHKFYKDSF